jgi:hypothetical protein
LELAMILELGTSHELIRVTAEYSNAVLVAIMPLVSNYAQKLELPVPQPITTAHVIKCAVVPIRDAGASVQIVGNWTFWFRGGYVNGFQGPHSYFSLQNPDEAPRFYGQVKMSKEEAIELARKAITNIGVSLESVFAEQTPRITGPIVIDTNVVPHYHIEWLDPRSAAAPAVDVEVDAATRRLERLRISSQALRKPPPTISVAPLAAPGSRKWPAVNPDYAWKLLPIVLHAVEDYCRTLSLPISTPLTTNQVARFHLDDNGGWPHSEIELTNGWRFVYRNSMVNGFYAPDNLFSSDKSRILIKDFAGKWNVSERDAVQLVTAILAKLNYPSNLIHIDFQPNTLKPSLDGIPRFFFSWPYSQDGQLVSKCEAEVDADKAVIKSFYYDHTAFWNHPPAIDVPISLPVQPSAPQAESHVEAPHSLQRPPERPMLHAIPPR